jgi:hypothetical protein
VNHARRVTVKLFLAHYHFIGRQVLGLPVRIPYICEKQPHQCIPPIIDEGDPEEFYKKYLEKYSNIYPVEVYRELVSRSSAYK